MPFDPNATKMLALEEAHLDWPNQTILCSTIDCWSIATHSDNEDEDGNPLCDNC